MTGFALDELDRWRGIYPREVYLNQLYLLKEKWKIGFEATNHYYFNKGMLAEKAICCQYLKNKLK